MRSRHATALKSWRDSLRVAVLGAGVVGVSTAYFLARDGHEVQVYDQAAAAGSDASAGNAGFIAPNDSYAWASPSAPLQLLRSLLGEPTGLRLRLGADPLMYLWALRFLRECTPGRARLNTEAQTRLSIYSATLQAELEEEEDIQYSVIRRGAFYLYRDSARLAAAAKRIPLFAEIGVRQELLTVDGIISKEPALAPSARTFAGGIYGVTDASGDCRAFTNSLLNIGASKYGVSFYPNTTIRRLVEEQRSIKAAITDRGIITADHFVLALGVGSPRIARTIGERLPIYPVKGYSVTFPVRNPSSAPTMPAVEQSSLIAWSRLGSSVRMSSTAEVGRPNREWTTANFRSIVSMAQELFADGIDVSSGEYRACLRPMTPDGPPILGYRKYPNLLFNTGHGHLGWTMGVGTGLIAADLVAGKVPRLALPTRWSRTESSR